MSPGDTRLFTARFRPWVALPVRMTLSGWDTPNSSAASVRQRSIISAAWRAAGWSPRPGVVMEWMAAATAAGTVSGFCRVVAALSK